MRLLNRSFQVNFTTEIFVVSVLSISVLIVSFLVSTSFENWFIDSIIIGFISIFRYRERPKVRCFQGYGSFLKLSQFLK